MNDNGGRSRNYSVVNRINRCYMVFPFLFIPQKKDLHQKRMELYHNLIYRLVARDPTKGLYLDSQIAIVYE